MYSETLPLSPDKGLSRALAEVILTRFLEI